MKQNARILVRLAMSAVVLWFGTNQLLNPALWSAWVPLWAQAIVPAQTLVLLNGTAEVILGLFLAIGLFTRLSALLLSLHVLSIAITIGYNDIGVRDFGIALALFSVFLAGADRWCVDKRFTSKNRILRVLLMHHNP